MLKPAAGFWELNYMLCTSLMMVALLNLRPVSFYLKAKLGSALLPEHCLSKKVVGEGSSTQCKAQVCPWWQDIVCHVEGSCGWCGFKL